MIQDIKKILNRLGLKNNEITIYLTCFNNKQGLFVSQIAQISKIKRSTVNLILERLIQKGFLTFHIEGSRKIYSAESPEVILFNFENYLADFKGIIPLLKAVGGQDKTTKIRFFEGKNNVEKIFNDQLLTMKVDRNLKKEILAISSGRDIFEIFPSHYKDFISKRIKERIPMRLLIADGLASQELKKNADSEYRVVKIFDDKKYPFNVEIDIYGDKISLINLSKTPFGVVVQNKNLAESFKSIFNLLWNNI